MAPRLGPWSLPWLGRTSPHDPYWDFFLKEPAADPRNSVPEIIRRATEGAVFPVKADVHTPEVTARHIKELARWLGADLVGIVGLDSSAAKISQGYPFGILVAVRADYDHRTTPGFGGQVPVQNGLFVTFILSAYIRELGYRATASLDPAAERLAATAGLGWLDTAGRLVTPKYGSRVHVADLVRTDLPLVADDRDESA